jgi:hypothetical protein
MHPCTKSIVDENPHMLKPLLVTGGCVGFICSHTASWLLTNGVSVIGPDNPNTKRPGRRPVPEVARPCRGRILPKALEFLADQIDLDVLDMLWQQPCEPHGRVVPAVLRPLEQALAELAECRGAFLATQLSDLLRRNLIDWFFLRAHDVDVVEGKQGFENLLTDDCGIRLPRVAAHEFDSHPNIIVEQFKESLQALLSRLMRNLSQCPDTADLLDERDMRMRVCPLRVVSANCLRTGEIAGSRYLLYRRFFRVRRLLLGSVKGDCRITSRDPRRQSGQEPPTVRDPIHYADRLSASFADHDLDRAIRKPHRIREKYRHGRERHDLPVATCKRIVTLPFLAASRAYRQHLLHHERTCFSNPSLNIQYTIHGRQSNRQTALACRLPLSSSLPHLLGHASSLAPLAHDRMCDSTPRARHQLFYSPPSHHRRINQSGTLSTSLSSVDSAKARKLTSGVYSLSINLAL